MASWTKAARAFLPPILFDSVAHWHRKRREQTAGYQYVPSGWGESARYRGWNVQSVLYVYQATWPRLMREAQTAVPFNIIMGSPDVEMQNILLCFAYSLALAAQGKALLSLLDWGGAIGQYKLLAQAALPGVPIEYHCKDVPLLAEYGQQINPDAHFSSDSSCLSRTYDFVLASSSLHYSEHWQPLLTALAQSTKGYLLLTRAPVHDEGASYVFSQCAYQSEYLGWSLSRDELFACAAAAGLHLVREFLISDADIPIANAPAPSKQRGFLFRTCT